MRRNYPTVCVRPLFWRSVCVVARQQAPVISHARERLSSFVFCRIRYRSFRFRVIATGRPSLGPGSSTATPRCVFVGDRLELKTHRSMFLFLIEPLLPTVLQARDGYRDDWRYVHASSLVFGLKVSGPRRVEFHPKCSLVSLQSLLLTK